MPTPSIESELLKTLSVEDKIIVISILITLILSFIAPIFWFLKEPIIIPPPIIATFLGIAVSALLYRFLGGIHGTTLATGALKITGAGAVLIFVAMWSNEELKTWVPNTKAENISFDISKHVFPKKEEWYAVHRASGLPIRIEFPNFEQELKPPTFDELNSAAQNRKLNLKSLKGSAAVYINSGVDMLLGKIDEAEFNELGYHKQYKVEFIPYKVVSFSAKQKVDINPKLPFLVETKGFSENYTSYSLLSRNSNLELHRGDIYLRNAEIVNISEKYYLVSVVQVNHETREPYAKIYVAEIKVNYV